MRYTSNRVGFYTMEDMQEICNKCQFASYDGDWSIQDCDYCVLPKAMLQMELIAGKLDSILESTIDQEDEEVIYHEYISRQFTSPCHALF